MHSQVLVAGLGKTGLSIARYLQRRNRRFVMFDTRSNAPGLKEFKQEFPQIEIYEGHVPDAVFEHISEIISSPGLSLEEPVFKKAAALSLPVYGDIECLAREIKAPLIAITGTNGKSTVTSLVGDMAKYAGINVAVAGNIGEPVLDLLDDGKNYDLWVLELSSFQLDLTFTLAPKAATILNISPDHLDRHHTLTAYIAAKQRIYQQAQTMIYNRDDAATYPAQPAYCRSFGLTQPATHEWGIIKQEDAYYLAWGDDCLLPVNNLPIKGTHNWQNALAACALAEAAGITVPAILKGLQQFHGLAHRCAWVRTLDGVDWINDSKGTNIGATCSALEGIGQAGVGKIILIAGGLGKGADFTELQSPVARYVRAVILIGQDAPLIAQALKDYASQVLADDMQDAVDKARAVAQPGDVVLLSPACASQDMFRDFNHRGEVFTKLVQQW